MVIIVNELLNFKVMESIMKHSLNNLYRAGNFKCVIEDELLFFIIYFNFNSLISENFFKDFSVHFIIKYFNTLTHC